MESEHIQNSQRKSEHEQNLQVDSEHAQNPQIDSPQIDSEPVKSQTGFKIFTKFPNVMNPS